MSEPRDDRLLPALEAVAARAAVADRLEPPGGEAVLRSVAEATVTLFDAEAASIALHDAATDRLVIRVAAGTAGDGAVGLSMGPSEGIVGYVFTTGQPLAVSDVAADPRFDRSAAQETGYVPRSILAVPLEDDGGTIGVLEVLDRRGDAGFGLHDIELASVFARQAAVAIRASRVEREVGELLRATLARLAADGTGDVPTRRSTRPWRPPWPGSTTTAPRSGPSPTPWRVLGPPRRARSRWSSRSSTRSPAAPRVRRPRFRR